MPEHILIVTRLSERDGAYEIFYVLGVIFGLILEQADKCRGIEVGTVLTEPWRARIPFVGEIIVFKILAAGSEHDAYLVVRIIIRPDTFWS